MEQNQLIDQLATLNTDEINNLLNLARVHDPAAVTAGYGTHSRQFDDEDEVALPDQILEYLESASASDLKKLVEKFPKKVLKFEGGEWTKSGVANQEFSNDLKRAQLDVASVLQRIFRYSDRVRVAARGSTEILMDLQAWMEDRGLEDDPALGQISDKLEELAIFGFAGAQRIDLEAREILIKALKLPTYMGHLAGSEDDNKRTMLSVDEVNRIQEARFQHDLIGKAANRGGFTNGQRGSHGRGRGNGRNGGFGRRGRGGFASGKYNNHNKYTPAGNQGSKPDSSSATA